MKPEPKVVIFDIETSLDILASYGVREQYHNPSNILQDWFMICACWKWSGQSKVHSTSLLDDKKRFKKCHTDDYHVTKTLHEVLSDADAMVGHNVDAFDWKKFMSRVMYHGLPPIAKPIVIDTLKEARKTARFTSYRLGYLTKFLGIEQKAGHASDMWLRILGGDAAAVKEAVKYCKQDVIATEALYEKIKPYMPTSPLNMGLWRADGIECCPSCGGEEIQARGFKVTKLGKYRRFQCTSCATWFSGTKRVKAVNHKK